MAFRSQRLAQSDIRWVFHLIGEITELGRDPARWRVHLLGQLLPRVDARLGLIGEHFISPANPLDTRITGMVELGLGTGRAGAVLRPSQRRRDRAGSAACCGAKINVSIVHSEARGFHFG